MPGILIRTLLLIGFLGHLLPAVAAVCNRGPVTDQWTGQRWERVTDCEHPEWPAKLVPLEGVEKQEAEPGHVLSGHVTPVSHPAPVEIYAGVRVELWSRQASGLHLTGVALETAAVGQPIRVRGGLGSATLRGIVRGPHSVELLAPGWERNP